MATPADVANNTRALKENTRQLQTLNRVLDALNTNLVALVRALPREDDDISKETDNG